MNSVSSYNYRFLRGLLIIHNSDIFLQLSPSPSNSTTANPKYFPIDYRVLRHYIIPTCIQADPGFIANAAHQGLLDAIGPTTGNKADQRQIFEIFFDPPALFRAQGQITPETSYFITTDGFGLSFSLKRDWYARLGVPRIDYLDHARTHRAPQDWNQFQRGISFLDNGIHNLDLQVCSFLHH